MIPQESAQCRSQQLVKITKWQDVAMDCYMLGSLAGIPLCNWFSNEALSFQTFRQYSLCRFEALEFHQTCMYSKTNGFDIKKCTKLAYAQKAKNNSPIFFEFVELLSSTSFYYAVLISESLTFSSICSFGEIACSKSYFFGFWGSRLVWGVEVVKPAESMHFFDVRRAHIQNGFRHWRFCHFTLE